MPSNSTEYNKKYYQNNKNHIKQLAKKGLEKIKCELCDVEFSKKNRSIHMKSHKHINNVIHFEYNNLNIIIKEIIEKCNPDQKFIDQIFQKYNIDIPT
jgi:hypothetical protein